MAENIKYSIAELLPHAQPMILVDRVIAHREDFIHVAVTIRREAVFFENGEVPSYVCLEYMAQAIGAWNGLLARQHNEEPQIGFLLGSRQLTLYISSFKEGLELDIYGQAKYNDGEMAFFECWIECQGERLAQAGLNVFQPKNVVL
ncbi:MAG TPA: hotdog family protein [Alphaproteobacteria bacterium]|nr:hotdog family protein [Alphaproteobacteria bacterium]